ncbi:MAG: iron-sulfur cluster assembly accessory protein [Halobacteriovoraceae bacterium]|nr:iron-sulfur cluster assembly accessory protein [Halobacteriovoraceae bacterium]
METLVNITEKAVSHITKIFKESDDGAGNGLRLAVIGGGCSGLSYKIDFGIEKENDRIIIFDEFNIYIDPKSSIYLRGVTLDYQDGLNGKGFIFTNPNATNTCGCGESFSV